MGNVYKSIWWLVYVATGEESTEDAKWRGRPGTTKTNKNITWVAAISKDNHGAGCRMIVESTGYRKPSNHRSPHSIWWFEKMKTVCVICAACVDSRTTGTARCSRKRPKPSPYSPDLSPPDYFVLPKLKMSLKRDWYATISDIQTSVMAKLKTIPITAFLRTMHQLEDGTNQCIAVNGDYFE